MATNPRDPQPGGSGGVPHTPPGPGPIPDTPGELDPTKRNAYELLVDMFRRYGLESLSPTILELIQKGYTQDTVMIMLQESDAYKQRFSANGERVKSGLKALSPAEYITLENTYRQVMESHGLPRGFYDQASDFTSWISNDVSPNEINERVQIGSNAVNNSDPSYIQALRRMGLGDGDLIAAALDRDRALPILQKVVKASQIGAEALRNGLTLDTSRMNQFADRGVTQAQAQQGYGTVAEALPTANRLSSIYGEQLGQKELEDEFLGQSGTASQKRKQLAQREAAQFSGSAGTSQRSLGTKSRGEF